MPTHRLTDSPIHRFTGFTLTELLVVVGLIILLVGVGVPSVKSMLTSGRVDNNARTVAAAVAAARAFAVGPAPVDGYAGAAALFTPDGEIRYVRHVGNGHPNNYDTEDGNPLPEGSAVFLDIAILDDPALEYVRLPSSVGVVGISRANVLITSAEDNPILLTPPFAVRFNREGTLVVDDSHPDLLNFYYDGNYNGDNYPYDIGYTPTQPTVPRIENQSGVIGSDRQHPYEKTGPEYNPDDWNPASSNYDQVSDHGDPLKRKPGFDPQAHQQRLPFERIETVNALIVYDKNAFHQAGFTLESEQVLLSTPGDSIYPLNFDPANNAEGRDPRRWLLENGSVLFFNPYDGKVVRQ